MQPSVPSVSIPRRILSVACLLASACVLPPFASAQRPVGAHAPAPVRVNPPVRIPVPRVATPPAPRAPMMRPQPGFRPGIQPGPVFTHHRVFIRPPFFRFRDRLYFAPYWWQPCGPDWTWQYNCSNLPYYPPPPENYVQQPVYEYPQYLYSEDERALVRLYLKDGTVYGVTDYWFVNDQLHFTLPDEEEEQVIGLDELDLQKTIDVNTRHGFRFVMRNEPMQQYLRDHPNDTPPLVQPPPKN
jgi:hypothetical protein